MSVRTLPMGARAVLLEVAEPAHAPALASLVRAALEDGDIAADDIVPAAKTVLVSGLSRVDAAVLADLVSAWDPAPLPAEDGPLVEIPVVFDGPDLEEVAGLWGTATEDVVARVIATELRVAFCGFAPGFAYMTGLPEELTVPRRDEPRTAVPAGSVGLAGPYAGIYPRSSPGGWQLIGTARGEALWDVERTPPALLAPGTRVRFVA